MSGGPVPGRIQGGTPRARRPGSLLCLPAAAALLLVLAPALPAQVTAVARGRVVRYAATDTVPVPDTKVILHRVGKSVQGPIDSMQTGRRGEFGFRFRADTASVYLLSSGWAGIEYFSAPVHTNPERPDTGIVIAVFDTSSSAPIEVTSRHLVIGKPAKDGTRPALEIVALANTGVVTRVAGDSAHPSWAAALPGTVEGFQPGSGDFSSDALVQRGDSVLLYAPISPGDKQILYTYSLPPHPGPVSIPVGDSIGAFNIMLEEFDRTVTGGGISRADSQKIEGHTFRQWVGPVLPGSIIRIDFPGARFGWLLPALVGAVALTLALFALRALRRPVPVPAPTPALDRLATLDARFAGREAEVPSEDWARYQEERARLKAELSAELARRRPPS